MKIKYEKFSERELLAEILEEIQTIRQMGGMKGQVLNPERFGYIDNAELLQLLCISDRTAWQWRTRGWLPYSKVGKKIYYEKKEVLQLMKDRKAHPEKYPVLGED